jgi:DNA-3-methyladenine glycosylase I
MLVLEGAQAGLSWSTILARREAYREAFAGFDPPVVAAFGPADVERLLGDRGIVRNRLKVEAAIANARAAVTAAAEHGSLDAFLWGASDTGARTPARRMIADVPATTPASHAMSRLLRARGFRFVGPTICYAFMQAVGMVNDHLATCFRRAEIERLPAGAPGKDRTAGRRTRTGGGPA